MGKSDPDIVTLFTVRLTIVSVMIFPFTVRSPDMSVVPDTVSVDVADAVPIPILDPFWNITEPVRASHRLSAFGI